MENKEKAWGWIACIDAKEGDYNKITNKEYIINFVNDLVEEIKMVKYGPLWIERFATHTEDKAGISFCQMIETSNITGHFCEVTGDFYIDCFSCLEFDVQLVVDLIQKRFNPKNIKYTLIERKA